MKTLLVVVILMVSGGAQAMDDLTCKGVAGWGTAEAITMTLSPVGKSVNEVNEGVRVPYKFVMKNGDKLWLDVIVKASQEDVYFGFEHHSRQYGDISGHVYMDELEQTGVSVNGTRFHFDCNSEE